MRQQSKYEPVEEDEEDAAEDEEVEQLTQEQYDFICQKQEEIKHLIPSALKPEELKKICIDFEFEEDKINEYL